MYLATDNGDVVIFTRSSDPQKAGKNLIAETSFVREPLHKVEMVDAIYTTPVIANDVLYIATQNRLYAIQSGSTLCVESSEPETK